MIFRRTATLIGGGVGLAWWLLATLRIVPGFPEMPTDPVVSGLTFVAALFIGVGAGHATERIFVVLGLLMRTCLQLFLKMRSQQALARELRSLHWQHSELISYCFDGAEWNRAVRNPAPWDDSVADQLFELGITMPFVTSDEDDEERLEFSPEAWQMVKQRPSLIGACWVHQQIRPDQFSATPRLKFGSDEEIIAAEQKTAGKFEVDFLPPKIVR